VNPPLTRALLLMLLPAPSHALELRRAGELRAGSGGFTEWLDPRAATCG
jgi:hypothetical protein